MTRDSFFNLCVGCDLICSSLRLQCDTTQSGSGAFLGPRSYASPDSATLSSVELLWVSDGDRAVDICPSVTELNETRIAELIAEHL